ncbi:MAG: flagellar motor switch protein FliN [Phenylobacterium sp.]
MNAPSKPPRNTREPEAAADAGAGEPLVSLDSAIFRDVRVELKVKLGQATLSIEELLALKSGAVLKLDRLMSEPVELFLNEALVARGEIVAVDDNFGIRLLEIAAPK